MKKIWAGAALAALMASSLYFYLPQTQMPEPYTSIRVLPFDSHGWYSNQKPIKKLIKGRKIQTVVEVGSWLGSSTRHIASLLPKKGKVYAVDHWLGSTEHQGGQSAWNPALPHLYQQFLSNVIHQNLTDKIVPLRMSSLEAAQCLKEQTFDMVYLDASRDTESVYKDLRAWFPFVKGRGVLCGDDWTWTSVVAAVEKFAAEEHLEIDHNENFWQLIEPPLAR